jgi:hypothetical protein
VVKANNTNATPKGKRRRATGADFADVVAHAPQVTRSPGDPVPFDLRADVLALTPPDWAPPTPEECERIRARDAAHAARMAAKVWPRFKKADLREEVMHAEVIAAAKDGRIALEPPGTLRVMVSAEDPAFDPAAIMALHEHLDSTGAKIAAYRAMGMPMAPVTSTLSWRARSLAHALEVVGGSDEAPVALIELAEIVAEAALSKVRAEGWQRVLAGIFKGGVMTFPSPPDKGVAYVLATLRASAPDVPAQFVDPSELRIKKAAAVIRKMRTNESRLIETKHGARRARPVGRPFAPWTWAAKFASALGAQMREKESATQRKR